MMMTRALLSMKFVDHHKVSCCLRREGERECEPESQCQEGKVSRSQDGPGNAEASLIIGVRLSNRSRVSMNMSMSMSLRNEG